MNIQRIKYISNLRFPENIETLLLQPEVDLNFGAYVEVQHIIQQWRVQKLWLMANQRSSILKQISNISFPCLKELNLANNFVTSIEVFQSIYFPQLASLWLGHNKITSIQNIRKASLPHLTSLDIAGNMCGNANYLTTMNHKLSIVGIENEHNRGQSQDVGWTLKLGENLNGIWIRGKERIRRKELESCLKRKVENVKVYVNI